MKNFRFIGKDFNETTTGHEMKRLPISCVLNRLTYENVEDFDYETTDNEIIIRLDVTHNVFFTVMNIANGDYEVKYYNKDVIDLLNKFNLTVAYKKLANIENPDKILYEIIATSSGFNIPPVISFEIPVIFNPYLKFILNVTRAIDTKNIKVREYFNMKDVTEMRKNLSEESLD